MWWKTLLGGLMVGWIVLLGTSSAVQVWGETVQVEPGIVRPDGTYDIFGASERELLRCTYFTGTGIIETHPRNTRYCRRIISLDRSSR